MSDPLFIVDGAGRVSYWSAGCEGAFRVPASAMVGETLPGALGADLDPGLLATLTGTRTAGSDFLPWVRIGGAYWDVRLSPTSGVEGTAVYCMPSVGHPDSWQHLVVESADAIWALDEEDRFIAWNRAAEEMFGYTAAEISGQPLSLLVPPDLLEDREPERLRTALGELGAVRDYETRRLTRDGREVRVSLTRTLSRKPTGEILGSSTIVRDLSGREQLERQMIEAEKLATVGQLAATVAQEIGAPLTTIRLAVESLRRLGSDRGDTNRQLDTVAQQVERIARLSRHLVDLAKPGQLHLRQVRLQKVVGQTLELIEPSLRRAGVSVRVDLPAALGEIRADSGQLQQVFVNLLINAQRALERDGGGTVTIAAREKRGPSTEGRPVRDVLEITVSDDGPGIDSADLPFVFAPFFSRSGGSGLGLPLARQIIHAHGGSIGVSGEGEGATFTILLPLESHD